MSQNKRYQRCQIPQGQMPLSFLFFSALLHWLPFALYVLSGFLETDNFRLINYNFQFKYFIFLCVCAFIQFLTRL